MLAPTGGRERTADRGAPRSESTILMLAGGKHTAMHGEGGPYRGVQNAGRRRTSDARPYKDLGNVGGKL